MFQDMKLHLSSLGVMGGCKRTPGNAIQPGFHVNG